MAGLQYEKLPADQTDQVKTQLYSQWQIEARALSVRPFRSQQLANAELAKLNAKYQRLEFDAVTKLQQQQEEQQRVQELIGQGTQGMGREEEAGLRMQLGPEAERLVFPTQRAQGQPYSMSALQGAISESIINFSDAAEDTSGWEWGPPKKTQAGLLSQYMKWRELISYDQINPIRQNQLDLQWDAYMRSDDRFDEWWTDDKKRKPIAEVSAERPTGKIGKAVRERVMSSAAAMTRQVTPIGSSIRKINIRPFRGFGVQTPVATPKEKPIRRSRKPRNELLEDYRMLGGGGTQVGRNFADKFLR
ncbi:hypothetical protein LCGC14_2954710 [marine sediment metagenome]|uniref:Uncharacterized protein n=1 Tax=marine sediment metagenome TaxID=412755 RepID=A0A0F8XEW0_9ZZZZ